MKIFPFLLILFFSSTNLLCQTNKTNDNAKQSFLIKGYVYDSSSTSGLEWATVGVLDRKKYSCLTKNGYFELELPIKFSKKAFSLMIAYAGHDPLILEVHNIEEIIGKELIFRLRKHNYSLDPISYTCCQF